MSSGRDMVAFGVGCGRYGVRDVSCKFLALGAGGSAREALWEDFVFAKCWPGFGVDFRIQLSTSRKKGGLNPAPITAPITITKSPTYP